MLFDFSPEVMIKDYLSDIWKGCQVPSVMVHTCNPSAQADTGLDSKTLSQVGQILHTWISLVKENTGRDSTMCE